VGHKTSLANEKDQEQCINARKTTFFGGWNVRSCFQQAKKHLIIKQLQKHHIQVAALSETAIYDSGISTIGDYTMIYSGVPSTNKTRSAHGVAICLNKQATAAWKNLGAVWEPVNERILMVRLQCTPINVTLLAIYSPVNPNGQQMAITASDNFYTDLQRTINKAPSNDLLLIMGDFNARVGKQQHHTSGNVVGPHAIDHINENGQRLVDFCAANNLIISNTFFQHKAVHQRTWMHPGNKKWHMLDYTLVNRKFRSSVEDVRVHRMAAGAIGTDHHLLRTKLKFHLKSRKKRPNQQPVRLDRKKLKNEQFIKAFQDELMNRPVQPNLTNVNINQKYAEFVNYVNNASEKIFKDHNSGKKQKAWLTDEIMEIVDEKARAFLEWQNYRGTNLERHYRSKYHLLRSRAKKKIKARQLEYWDEISMEIETAIKQHDPATAYSMIRRLRGGRTNVENLPIQDKRGNLLLNSQERLDRWKEYFNELLNVPSNVNASVLHHIPIPTIPTTEQLRQDKLPSLTEVQQAIKQMKSGKAPGNDNISADVLKAGGLPMAKWLHEVFVGIWQNEDIVDDWTTAILIRLYKNKGDKRICDNYRGISLLVVASKVLSRIILNRIQSLLDKQLMEEQAGFRTNRSTIDQIFILKMVMEKSRNYNKPLFMCFIDIQKAYDSVNRDLLWQICKHYGLTSKIVRMLQLLYKNTRAQVKINGDLSDSFNIETGVLQGGITSCILFNILFDFIMRRVIDKASAMGVTGIKLAYGTNDFLHTDRDNHEDFHILALMYADDLVTMCDNALDLEIFIRTFEQITQELGLTMSIKKTCIMSLKQLQEDGARRIIKDQEVATLNIDINIRNQTIEVVDQFSYLGCYIIRDQSLEKEIETRMSKASTAFNMLRHVIWYRKTISIQAKLRFFRACVLPVLLYGSEVWSTTAAQERRLNTFYFKCLRTIIGVNLGDRMSNDKLLQLTGQPYLNDILTRNRLRWFGHANRMNNVHNETSVVKKAMFSYFSNCRRPRNCGVQKRWEDKILNDIDQCKVRN
jgi:exonuclease III